MTATVEDATKWLAMHADSLIEEKRIAKRPLRIWIEELSDRVTDIRRRRCDPDDLAMVQNNLGLVLLHSRGPCHAFESCARQIAWAAALRRCDLMLQPIINLARIDRLTGRSDDARIKIATVRDAGCGAAAVFDGNPFAALSRSDRDFAMAVSLIERFQIEIAAGPDAVATYFADPLYVSMAANGSAMFAEQKLQAGLIYRCPVMFRSGQAVISSRPATSFAAIVGQFYTALWLAEWEGDTRPALRLVNGLLKVSRLVLADPSPCDHRVLRLFHAAARMSERYKLAPTRQLYHDCERLAVRLEDVHFGALAKIGLNYSPAQVAGAINLAGYRSLRGVQMPAPSLPSCNGALDDLIMQVDEARRDPPAYVAA